MVFEFPLLIINQDMTVFFFVLSLFMYYNIFKLTIFFEQTLRFMKKTPPLHFTRFQLNTGVAGSGMVLIKGNFSYVYTIHSFKLLVALAPRKSTVLKFILSICGESNETDENLFG